MGASRSLCGYDRRDDVSLLVSFIPENKENFCYQYILYIVPNTSLSYGFRSACSHTHKKKQYNHTATLNLSPFVSMI
jgi:hypothetical protein